MINIVGSGVAGLSTAIHLAKDGKSSNLISVQEAWRAQSVMAEGGINAALDTMNENDSPDEHYADTLKGGAYLADKTAVRDLTNKAPDIVMWLKEIGVPFEVKGGKIIQRNFGGQRKKRTAYVKSSTGKMLMTALCDEARKYETAGLIRRFSHHEVYDVVIEDGRCRGIKLLDKYTGKTLRLNGQTVLACGGLTGFFPSMTTGSTDNTGKLVSDLFIKGVKLANLEMIQYHPTTIEISGKRMLISEAARGEGARFMTYENGEPYYFMEKLFPEEGNLVTRDIAARTIDRILQDERYDHKVYLDLRGIDKSILNGKLSDLKEEIRDHFDIDISKEPIRIYPGIHYFMGGVCVDNAHQSSIPGLYAAGECACIYHGANRLGGNSLLGAIYGGMVIAGHIPEDTDNEIMEINEDISGYEIRDSLSARIRDILKDGMGIIRNEQGMLRTIDDLDGLFDENLTYSEKNKIITAKAMLKSALSRKESRGAHYRSDYPEPDDNYLKTTVASYDTDINIEFTEFSGE